MYHMTHLVDNKETYIYVILISLKKKLNNRVFCITHFNADWNMKRDIEVFITYIISMPLQSHAVKDMV